MRSHEPTDRTKKGETGHTTLLLPHATLDDACRGSYTLHIDSHVFIGETGDETDDKPRLAAAFASWLQALHHTSLSTESDEQYELV
jgi:hypothetical protein